MGTRRRGGAARLRRRRPPRRHLPAGPRRHRDRVAGRGPSGRRRTASGHASAAACRGDRRRAGHRGARPARAVGRSDRSHRGRTGGRAVPGRMVQLVPVLPRCVRGGHPRQPGARRPVALRGVPGRRRLPGVHRRLVGDQRPVPVRPGRTGRLDRRHRPDTGTVAGPVPGGAGLGRGPPPSGLDRPPRGGRCRRRSAAHLVEPAVGRWRGRLHVRARHHPSGGGRPPGVGGRHVGRCRLPLSEAGLHLLAERGRPLPRSDPDPGRAGAGRVRGHPPGRRRRRLPSRVWRASGQCGGSGRRQPDRSGRRSRLVARPGRRDGGRLPGHPARHRPRLHQHPDPVLHAPAPVAQRPGLRDAADRGHRALTGGRAHLGPRRRRVRWDGAGVGRPGVARSRRPDAARRGGGARSGGR